MFDNVNWNGIINNILSHIDKNWKSLIIFGTKLTKNLKSQNVLTFFRAAVIINLYISLMQNFLNHISEEKL